ncbi:MAG: aquaporin [Gemmatimonadaceae bacterium]
MRFGVARATTTLNTHPHRVWHFRRYAAELLGTGVLVLFGVGSSMIAERTHAFGIGGIALAFGLIVAVLIVAIGKISGAHINPAVTLALWSQRHFHGRDVLPYIVAQCLGAIAGAALLLQIFGPMGTVGVTLPVIGAGLTLVIEMAYSALLSFAIFYLAADARIPRNYVPPMIGLVVFVGARITGPITGGSFNPARSLGPAFVNGIWQHHWIYWVAPIVGMWIGAAAHAQLRVRFPLQRV